MHMLDTCTHMLQHTSDIYYNIYISYYHIIYTYMLGLMVLNLSLYIMY